MTYDELMQAIQAQAQQRYGGGLAEADGGIRDAYSINGISQPVYLNSGENGITPYFWNPSAPQNQAGYNTNGGIAGTFKNNITRNPDGTINTDSGYFSKKSTGIDAVMDKVPMIGAALMGGAALGAGMGAAAGSSAGGAAATESALPAWVSAEGGAGYAGGMAADGAIGSGLGGLGGAGWVSGADLPAGEMLGSGITNGAGLSSSVAAPVGVSGASGGGIGSTLGSVGGMLNSPLGVTALGGLLGAVGSASAPDKLTSTNQQNIDPRMASILYGANGNDGFLNKILANGDAPQKAGMAGFGSAVDSYLGANGVSNLAGLNGAASSLQNSNIGAPQINAPSQNGLDLSSAYNKMIYGDPAQNPYLTGAIQKGINQSNTAFQNMQTDLTRNLNEKIMPSIRGGAIVNGQMGSSRQGIAEGNALNDYSTQMGRALSQYGQNNTDSAVSAQAGAYESGQNRALSAMSGLGAQQYGVAQNNAQLQAQNNQLNSANKIAGIGAGSGLLSQAYGMGQNNDAYAGNKIAQTSGLLGQYTGLGGSSTSSQPLYQNTMGNIMGGATAGLGLYNAFNNANKNDYLNNTDSSGFSLNDYTMWN